MNNYLMKIIFVLNLINTLKCEPPVSGRCSRPGVPPNAYKYRISPERGRFQNKEKVDILCKEDGFPLLKHQVECRNGRWIGKQARCGRYMRAQVTRLDIHECQTQSHQLLLQQTFNLSSEPQLNHEVIPHNAYHWLRVAESAQTSANGSNCYTFRITFDTKVQIWFLLAEIRTISTEKNITLNVSLFISKYRTCVLHENELGYSEGTVFKSYFICDLKNDSEYKKEQLEAPEVITLTINTNFEDEVGLDGLFIGDVFTATFGNNNNVRPDCGELEIRSLGIDLMKYSSLLYIMCNDSFVDISGQNITNIAPNHNPMHKFRCNWNGLWVGHWPVCVPIKTCPKERLEQEKDSTVIIEEIGNVYYLNENKWFAINDSFIRYRCVDEKDIMFGNKFRTCMKSGHWSSKAPSCNRAGISGLGIAGILFAILIVFVLIVLVVFRMHSKNVKRELKATRSVIIESTRKRHSDEFYTDLKEPEFYDSPHTKSQNYELVDYEDVDGPRYLADPNHNKTQHEYLAMTSFQ